MKKLVLLTMVCALAAVSPALATNDGGHVPRDPCAHNPTTLCDHGEQQPSVGGYDCAGKLVPPGGVPSLCPGTPGKDGAAGAAGASGAGTPGADGADAAAASCRSKRVVTITLPRAYAGAKRVKALVAGQRRSLAVSKRKVRVSFAGLRGGLTAAVIGARGKPTVKRFYVLCADGNIGGSNLPFPPADRKATIL